MNAALPGSPVTYSFFVVRDEEPALVETGFAALFDDFIEGGDGPALIDDERTDAMVRLYESTGFLPSKAHLDLALDKIEALRPATFACHHGSVKGGNIPAYFAVLRGLRIGPVDWNPLLMAEPGR